MSQSTLSKLNHKPKLQNPTVSTWETDPGSGAQPIGGRAVSRLLPDTTGNRLPMTFPPAPAPAGTFPPGSPEFRYWAAVEALIRGRNMWQGWLPAGARWNPNVGNSLLVLLDDGLDLNAYYDRRSLSFFHQTVQGLTVYSGESPDVICHELGHAILDLVQPALFDAHFAEAAAFHEAFGDISAMLSALQLPEVRDDVLLETENAVYRNSRLSRLAEQLGWAIRVGVRADAVDPDCLRNAANGFVYRDPATLPHSAPAASLSSEPHSFSRVFSSAFLLALALVFQSRGVSTSDALLQVANDVANWLLQAIARSPVVPRYFTQIAGYMVGVAPAADQAALHQAFTRKGLMPLQAMAAVRGVADGAVAGPQVLSNVVLDGGRFGLMGPLHVPASSQAPQRAVGFGPVGPDQQELSDSPTASAAAEMFVSELFARGKVSVEADGAGVASGIGTLHTHRVVKDDGHFRMERTRIDCGFCIRH